MACGRAGGLTQSSGALSGRAGLSEPRTVRSHLPDPPVTGCSTRDRTAPARPGPGPPRRATVLAQFYRCHSH
eukprot:763976-Hanusia_phi.AAC.3